MKESGVLPVSFYCRPAETVARELLGKKLVRVTPEGKVSGMIVETEAYLGPGDEASHSAGGMTRRNATMFAGPGRAYVYLIYGIHYCFNVTTDREEIPSAVLIRALEPVEGKELMGRRRGRSSEPELCSGPGKLAQALAIDTSLDGTSLLSAQLYLLDGAKIKEHEVVATTRVGINKAADARLRFYIRNNKYISTP